MVDIIAVAAITIGFALYFFPTDEDGLMGWKRVIPVVLIAVYWISRGRLFRWLDRPKRIELIRKRDGKTRKSVPPAAG
jgi:hypothetical protein